ncbi:membrane protein [Clostridia bacterium]|nr:membrane protein [Clostridia bacterium]
MSKILREKLNESIKSLLPIIVIVLVLNFTVASEMPFAVRGMFIVGSLFLVIGMAIFTLGADLAMMPIGEHLGNYLSKSGKIWLIVIAALLMGTMVTIAEPDLQILALMVPGIQPSSVLTTTVAVGLGVFLVLAMLRILFNISMAKLLSGCYIGALILGIFVTRNNPEYFAVSFDAGGVTTGPFAIPFILALGVGVSAVRGGKNTQSDGFGLAALCSIGPIYAVMILSFFYGRSDSAMTPAEVPDVTTIPGLFGEFMHELPHHMYSILLAVVPLIALFLIFQFAVLHLPKSTLIKIGFGLVYTYFGLVIFITGVSVGFMPAGVFIGKTLGFLEYNWILIPIGAIMGYFIVLAEPAVHVLVEEVEALTAGAISKPVMTRAFSISIAIAIALAMVRVLTGLSIWWILVPGYALAIILTKFSPKIFTAVAFDSGAVASGPMTATFVLPFTMGVCEAAGGNIMMDAFGVVALVAMTPLFTVQIVGLVYKRKMAAAASDETEALESISQTIEEQKIKERWGRSEYSDEESRFDAEVDMDYAASPEWAEEVISDQIVRKIAKDDDYIDFDLLEEEDENEI